MTPIKVGHIMSNPVSQNTVSLPPYGYGKNEKDV